MPTFYPTDEPLVPAVHALALLPSAARQYAPSALRHLMGNSSPLADIYEQCDACTSFRKQIRSLNKVGASCVVLISGADACHRTSRRPAS